MRSSKILFQLSGSIAGYKACSVISALVQEGHSVKVAASAGAMHFIGAATLEGLSGGPVFTDIYQSGRMMDHIHLAQWADLAVLCPASASAISRLAHGDAGDVLGALYLAYDPKKPYLLAPAMNQAMFQHPAVQDNLKALEKRGVSVLPTDSGHQACGDVGPGRLLEPVEILERIKKTLSKELM